MRARTCWEQQYQIHVQPAALLQPTPSLCASPSSRPHHLPPPREYASPALLDHPSLRATLQRRNRTRRWTGGSVSESERRGRSGTNDFASRVVVRWLLSARDGLVDEDVADALRSLAVFPGEVGAGTNRLPAMRRQRELKDERNERTERCTSPRAERLPESSAARALQFPSQQQLQRPLLAQPW